MKRSGLATPRSGLDAISRSWREISYSRSSQGDRGFESVSLQRGASCEPKLSGGHPIDDRRVQTSNPALRGSNRIQPLAADPKRIAAVFDADKKKAEISRESRSEE